MVLGGDVVLNQLCPIKYNVSGYIKLYVGQFTFDKSSPKSICRILPFAAAGKNELNEVFSSKATL